MTPDQQLMQSIETKYGSFIAEAVKGTPFPAALVAALVANETGLNESATRFESNPFYEIAFVLIGRKPNFGAITKPMLLAHIPAVFTPDQVALSIINLATSWGPTQIMGYQALAAGYSLAELSNLDMHFKHTVELLAAFQQQFKMLAPRAEAPGAESGDYFRCWNGGSPRAKTFDPNYAANGVNRMAIYEALG